MARNELHVAPSESGHRVSSDCWCEPAIFIQRQSSKGIIYTEVRHTDNHDEVDADGFINPRANIILKRSEENDWVTDLLDSLKV